MRCENCDAENCRVQRGEGFICYECAEWNEGFGEGEEEDNE